MTLQSDKNATVNKIQESAETLSSNVHTTASAVGQNLRSAISSAGDEIAQAGDKVSTQIRTYPVQSTVIALGVGVLLGALLRR